jgi:RNA polymerase sigma factor (sigma-70 family)
MAGGRFYHLIQFLRRSSVPGDAAAPDAQLLHRYAVARDEGAFAAVAARHAAMVLGVCRRVLGNAADAEDAFQATFLVLARKAHAAAQYRSVGGWLHTVAFRVALRAQARRAARGGREMPLEDLPARTPDPAAQASWREVSGAIDHEVNRLPEKYRLPFVLHYFEGRSAVEVARELGCPVGTVESWLARARQKLRDALTRRKVAMAPAVLAALAVQGGEALAAWADWPQHALAAARAALPGATTGDISSEAAQLAAEVQRGLHSHSLKAAAGLLAFLAIAVGVVVLVAAMQADHEPSAPTGQPDTSAQPAPKQQPAQDKPAEKQPGQIRLTKSGTAFEPRMGQLESLAISPDACFLAGGGDPFCIKWWAIASGEEQAFLQRPPPARGDKPDHLRNGQQERPLGLAFSPEGKKLISGGATGEVMIWDLHGNTPPVVLRMHSKIQIKALVLRPDGRTLVTAAAASDPAAIARLETTLPTLLELKVWDLDDGKELAFFQARTEKQIWFCGALSADGRTLAWGSDDGLVRLWDVDTGKERLIRSTEEPGNGVECIALSSDGKLMAVGRSNRQIQLWQTDRLQAGPVLKGHTGSPRALLFSTDGHSLFAGTGLFDPKDYYAIVGGELCQWDTHTGDSAGQTFALDYLVSALAQSERGRLVVSAGVKQRLDIKSRPREGKITVWNVVR